MGMLYLMAARLGMRPHLGMFFVHFFIYSFIGYLLEVVVLTVEKKNLVLNRGFVKHLPFCTIYGVGGMVGFVLLSPYSDNLGLIYVLFAMGATGFEFFVAKLQTKMFGDFWWDYKEKPFNYKGMLCLESTLFWGLLGVFLVKILHPAILKLISFIPVVLLTPIGVGFVILYALDFTSTTYHEKTGKQMKGISSKLAWKDKEYNFNISKG